MKKSKGIFVILVLLILTTLGGCSMKKLKEEEMKKLEFTVVTAKEIPQKLAEAISDREKEEFQLAYLDGENLYIARGYGQKPTGGYSIQVNALVLCEESIQVEMDLTGPLKSDEAEKTPSCPYIVIKTERREEAVVFR